MKDEYKAFLALVLGLLVLAGSIVYAIKDRQGGLTDVSPYRFRAEIDDLKARVEKLEKEHGKK